MVATSTTTEESRHEQRARRLRHHSDLQPPLVLAEGGGILPEYTVPHADHRGGRRQYGWNLGVVATTNRRRCLRQSNQGQTWAINRGFASATGAYIRFLDSDDFLCPGAIDRQYQAAIETGADIVYSKFDEYWHPQGKIIEGPEIGLWDDFMAVQLGESYASHFLGMLFKRELVAQVPRRPDFAFREDRMFLLEIALLSPKVAHVPGCAGYWVQHADQMQANYRGLKAAVVHWQHWQIYRRVLAELDRRGDLTPRRERAAARALWPLAHWMGYSHPSEAAEVADWVYQLDPSFRPPEPGWLGMLYRRLGFRKTETILLSRRRLLALVKSRQNPRLSS